jgi:hypothetical protein
LGNCPFLDNISEVLDLKRKIPLSKELSTLKSNSLGATKKAISGTAQRNKQSIPPCTGIHTRFLD